METSGASRPCPASVCLIRRPPVSEPIYLGQFDFSKITPAEREKAFPNYRLEAIGNPGGEALNVALPSTITVHAPHCAMLQPNFVPLSPSVSRSTHSSGVRGSSLVRQADRSRSFESPCPASNRSKHQIASLESIRKLLIRPG